MTRRKDGLWQEVLTINGKKKYFYGHSKADVIRKIAAFEAAAQEQLCFEAAADRWDAWHAARVSHNTDVVYKAPLRRAKERFAGREMVSITPDEIQAFIRDISAQGYARRTVQLHLDLLRMIFDYTITTPGSGISVNPCSAVRMPSGLPRTRRLPPTDEQLAALEADSEMGLFSLFLLYTGLRRGELLGLRWEDIDLKNRILHVRRSIYYDVNSPVVKPPKTEAGIRTVDILDPLAEKLTKPGKGYIFGGDAPLTKTQFYKRWLNYCRSIGLAEEHVTTTKGKNGRSYSSSTWKASVTPHQFRHAYASMLDDAGIDETVAKSLLGHSSIAVTKDVYTHLRESKRKRAGEALNAYLKGKNV